MSADAKRTEEVLVEAALKALEAFAAVLVKSDLGLEQRRCILQIAWDTAREGDALLGHEEALTVLNTEETALAELGATSVACAIEAQLAGSADGQARSCAPPNVPAWEWIRWRVDACARAAFTAGLDQNKCESLRHIGASLLEPYRKEFERLRQQEIRDLKRQEAQEEQRRREQEQKALQEHRIQELQELQGQHSDPEMQRAIELEMNELQAQVSSDWPPAGGLEEPRRPENPAVLDHAEETGNQRREDLRDLPETATEDREGQSKSEVKSQVDEKRQKLDQLQSSSRSGAPAGAVATDPAMVEQKMGETKDEESEVRSAAEIESAAEIGSRGTLKVEKKLLVQTDLDASHSEHEREEKLEGHTLGTGRSNDADGNAGATHLVEADGHENRVADGGTGRPVHEATTGSRVVDFMSASTTRATDARATAADAGGEDDAQEAETTRSSAGPTRAGITDSAGITPGRASSMLETEGRSPMLKSQEADTKDTEKEKSMSQGEEVEDQVREKSKSKSAGRSSSAKEVEPEGVGGVSKEPIVTADTSSDVSQAPKVLWVEPSGAAATSGWQGPLSAREVLKLAEEQTLGPDGLVWGLAGGSVEPPPEGAPGALPLWQCLPELGQHLRRASEAQLQERLQKRFQKMPRQEDATDVLPN